MFYVKGVEVFSSICSYFVTDNHYMCFLGIILFLGIAVLFSSNKKKIKIERALAGLGLQLILALFVLKTEIGFRFFSSLAAGFSQLYRFTDEGIKFMFGNLINAQGPWGFLFIVKVAPIIIFFGAFMALLYHIGIIQFFVKMLSFVIRPLLGTSGAETLCATANSMLGPTESPLLVKKYLKNMTDSEIFVVMVAGMSTLAASVMAAYGSMGVPIIHIITSSVMSIPGALMISKIMLPETKMPETAAGNNFEMKKDTANVLDAISAGTYDGLKLAAGVAAMLIAFMSLMAMVDYLLLALTGYNLDAMFAKIFSSVAIFLGIGVKDRAVAGTLLGQKLVINEFIAYLNFVKMTLAERSKIILTYALCGFANISVIGILIGGVGALAPSKRSVLTRLGWKALLGATLVNLLNAAIAGLLI
jgi:CNT family concentrative nucleoside transporter